MEPPKKRTRNDTISDEYHNGHDLDSTNGLKVIFNNNSEGNGLRFKVCSGEVSYSYFAWDSNSTNGDRSACMSLLINVFLKIFYHFGDKN